MKNPTTPATTSPTTPVLRTKHLAIKFGIKATQLRRYLRAMPAYADGVHTNYSWPEGDKRIADIEKHIAKAVQEKAQRAEAAKAALAARTAATAEQAKLDKKTVAA